MMKSADKLIFGFILGLFFPILFMEVAFLFWFYLFQEYHPLYFMISGLFSGIIADILFLKKLIDRVYDLSAWMLTVFFLFFNINIYGFFMGLPVFNLIMGIIAGYYYGMKFTHKYFSDSRNTIIKRNVSLFSALVMLLLCSSSAVLALREKTIGNEIQNMLGVGFEVTKGMVISIILAGGISLILAQYFLTGIVLKKTIEMNYHEHSDRPTN